MHSAYCTRGKNTIRQNRLIAPMFYPLQIKNSTSCNQSTHWLLWMILTIEPALRPYNYMGRETHKGGQMIHALLVRRCLGSTKKKKSNL